MYVEVLCEDRTPTADAATWVHVTRVYLLENDTRV